MTQPKKASVGFWAVLCAALLAYGAVALQLYSYSFPTRVPVRLQKGAVLIRRPIALPVATSSPKEAPLSARPVAIPMPRKQSAAVPVSAPRSIAEPFAPKSVPAIIRTAVPDVPIRMASVAVLSCLFVNSSGGIARAYGSGVVVSSSGYILTARHVVDLEYAYLVTAGRQGVSGYRLTGCEVGMPPVNAKAPSAEEIRAINPFTEVSSLSYRASLVFTPANKSVVGLSDPERQFIDLALLKISGVTHDAERFFGAVMPASFVASPLGGSVLPAGGETLISFGFPSGAPEYGRSFYLQGSVGTVNQYVVGDILFKNEPIGIHASMETISGRSGSPVFSRGQVVGIVSGKEEYSRNATIISVYPLGKLLEGSGISF